jgi:hypothetical protein
MAGGLTFFFDNCMSTRLARALQELAFFPKDTIRHQKDDPRFKSDSLDVDIYNALAGDDPRPVVVSSDLSQKTRGSPERQALRASGLTAVFFAKNYANLRMHPQAVLTIKVWPDIREAVSRCTKPTLFVVAAQGKVKELCPTASL